MDNRKPSLVNRRYLRIKVFQGVYAFFRTEDASLQKTEREVFESIDRLYDLYLYLLNLTLHVQLVAKEMIQENKQKNLPTDQDLNPNTRFVENLVFKALKSNTLFAHLTEKAKVDWTEEHDDIRRLFKTFREDEGFKLYMIREEAGLQIDKDLISKLFTEYLGVNHLVHSVLEEKDIYWRDDLPMAAMTVLKTIEQIPDDAQPSSSILADLYKNKSEDKAFVEQLIRKTIEHGESYESEIAKQADNWELDRIALLDMLLMKMALTELEHFPTIPVKVTLNEYIEMAKVYSTPKSKLFINGVLDKLVAQFKRDGRLNKSGRGLKE